MKDLSVGQESIDAAMAKMSWTRRNRPWLVAGGYLAVAAVIAIAATVSGGEAFYKLLALTGQPMLTIMADTIGAWPAVAVGVLVNAGAIGFALRALDRFAIRMDSAGDLALRVYGRDKE
jgi:hypothetical protein